MLKNFFLVALRNLRKQRLYSFINITGLSVGIACSILIILWVVDEISYDKFIPKSDRLYQVWLNGHFDGTINSWRSVPLPLYEAIKDADANIVNSVVTDWGYEHLITVDEETKLLKEGYWVSEEFLEMFEFPLVKGDPATVLDDPSSIVITESLAEELFGDEDPIGKVVRMDNEFDSKVTGVLKDIPGNSSFEFELLVPWKKREQVNEWVRDNMDNWGNNSFQVFIELNDPSNQAAVEDAVRDLITRNHEDRFLKELFLYPMERWRLYSNFEAGEEVGGLVEYVQLFSAIAIAILVIACINFMNLSTARSEKRAKEVGIRKSIGSRRIDLIFQFLGESLVLSLIATVIAILIILAILPLFNEMVEKQLYLDFLSIDFWLFTVGIIVITGILAGSYPAFYLSSFNPARTLKGSITQGKNSGLPRKILVIFQFGIAIILLVGTAVVYQQIEMVRSRELGYDQNRLIYVDYTDEVRDNYDAIKNELIQSGYVESVTRSNSPITQIHSNNFLGWPGKPEDLEVIFTTITAHYDYVETMGMDLIMGRDFDEEIKSDSAAIVINRAALELMELEEPIIGTELDLWGEKRPLIGVTDDVLMGSVYEEVKPMFVILDDWGGVVTMRLSGNREIQESLSSVEDIFRKYNPAYPFDYEFADVDFENKFTILKLTRRLAISFAVLAIIITSLGLFGLASYTAEQRTKEIGIRKVLGASVTNLVTLMSRDFTILVVISFILAAPLSWYMMDSYLERYTIRVDIAWWILPLAGFIALGFALLIVSNQARRAAQANPVDSLRNE